MSISASFAHGRRQYQVVRLVFSLITPVRSHRRRDNDDNDDDLCKSQPVLSPRSRLFHSPTLADNSERHFVIIPRRVRAHACRDLDLSSLSFRAEPPRSGRLQRVTLGNEARVIHVVGSSAKASAVLRDREAECRKLSARITYALIRQIRVQITMLVRSLT